MKSGRLPRLLDEFIDQKRNHRAFCAAIRAHAHHQQQLCSKHKSSVTANTNLDAHASVSAVEWARWRRLAALRPTVLPARPAVLCALAAPLQSRLSLGPAVFEHRAAVTGAGSAGSNVSSAFATVAAAASANSLLGAAQLMRAEFESFYASEHQFPISAPTTASSLSGSFSKLDSNMRLIPPPRKLRWSLEHGTAILTLRSFVRDVAGDGGCAVAFDVHVSTLQMMLLLRLGDGCNSTSNPHQSGESSANASESESSTGLSVAEMQAALGGECHAALIERALIALTHPSHPLVAHDAASGRYAITNWAPAAAVSSSSTPSPAVPVTIDVTRTDGYLSQTASFGLVAMYADSMQQRRRQWAACERQESRLHSRGRSVQEIASHATLVQTNPLLGGAHWSSFAVIANELEAVIRQTSVAANASHHFTSGSALTAQTAAANAHSMAGIECVAVDDNVHRWSVRFTAAAFPSESAIAQQLRQLECVLYQRVTLYRIKSPMLSQFFNLLCLET